MLFEGFDKTFHNKDFQIKPFLKWAGGKFKLLENIKAKLPQNKKRYIEPFLGGGAVALNIDYPEIIVSDVNPDLVNVYLALRDLEDDFIIQCEEIFDQKYYTEEKYYQLRNEFNSSKDKIRKAVLFIYLNKHCFNGLCRYNKNGLFNTPMGGTKTVLCPSKEMKNAIPKLKRMDIGIKTFEEAISIATSGDVVYCDPPYLPLSEKQAFVQYSTDGFALKEHKKLACISKEASDRGAVVVISNHNTQQIRDLYSKYGAELEYLEARRSIGGKNAKRGNASELFAIFQ